MDGELVELVVPDVRTETDVARLRWELFNFAEVRDVFATRDGGRVLVLHDGDEPDVAAWLDALRVNGYSATLSPTTKEG